MPPLKLPFVKMHGAGNDFIVINALQRLPFDLKQFIPRACDRHFGIGADGLLLLKPSKQADYTVVYFNADGSRSVCGNGTRCIARYIFSERLVSPDRKSFDLETDNGTVRVEVIGRGDRIRTEFRGPIFDGARIPISEPGEWVEQPIEIGGKTVTLTAVGMGNSHGVVFVENLDQIDVASFGAAIHSHPLFPQKANVEFVQIHDRQSVSIKIFERGVGPTMACGTGACAVLAAGVREGKLDRVIELKAPGGEFQVVWAPGADRIQLTGPAHEIFRAEIDVEQGLGIPQLPLGSGMYPAYSE